MTDPEVLERIAARRAELDGLEEQLAKQLSEVRRNELAEAERVLQRINDPEQSTRVRIRLLNELVATGGQLVASHLPFPSVCHVAAAGNSFRFVAAVWNY
ncbi:hypothetical protein [Streptomyces sp. NPDC048425]|uniref:hypothetical protein n=1 Tax=Streptomyces sp. NPDC048425 TaxID=3365548 RepID=UPI0037149B68